MLMSSNEPSDLIAAVRSKRVRCIKLKVDLGTYDEEPGLPTVIDRLIEELDNDACGTGGTA